MNAKKKFFMAASMLSSLIYISWRIIFTVPMRYGLLSMIAGIALVTAETIGVIEAFFHYRNISANNYVSMPQVKPHLYPDVDVFIATHSEDVKLLYKTVNGAINMKYPDKSKVHVYICDDNNRPEMKELAQHMGVGYFGLSDNKHAKAGNLNNAIEKTNSPLIVTFDADMIPRSNFLLETVPYFFLPIMKEEADGSWVKREKHEIDKNFVIGFIQTPQSFYNTDLFQFNFFAEKNIPNEQDFFFREVNVGRNHSNSPIYAGSNTVLSRTALEHVGGIKTGTITEDFATGIDIQARGYTCYAVPQVLAHGLAPGDFKSLIKQRQRWGRGCVQSLMKRDFIFGKLKFRTKLSYISSFLYWWTFTRRLIYILSPILYTVFGIVVVDTSLWELFLIWLPSYLLYNRALKVLSGDIRDQKWSNIVDTILFPYMIIPIVAETFGIKKKKFFVTPKEKVFNRTVQLRYAIPHMILAFGTVVGLYLSMVQLIVYESIGSIVLVFWLMVNLYFLVMAIIFMFGRVNYRNEDRLYAKVSVKISSDYENFEGITTDISESGMAVLLDIPHYVENESDLDIVVENEGYKSRMKVRLVHVKQSGLKWKYSLVITEISDMDRREYLNIVFDRKHTLPVVIKSHIIQDIKDAIFGKFKHNVISNRKLPRIPLDKDVYTENGQKVRIINFNYQYLLIEGIDLPEHILLNMDNKLELDCTLVSKNVEKATMLFQLEKWEKLAKDKQLAEVLFKS
ncbi:MAG: glycosyltransferase [Firmicutes bacterium]|jgi:cellulose synthase (UDP-forming)|nr:glycosyltransferase [Bacillota bacterium]